MARLEACGHYHMPDNMVQSERNVIWYPSDKDVIDIALETRYFNPSFGPYDDKSLVEWYGGLAGYPNHIAARETRKIVVYSEIYTEMSLSKLRNAFWNQVEQHIQIFKIVPGLQVLCLCKWYDDMYSEATTAYFESGYMHYACGGDTRVKYFTVSENIASKLSTMIARKYMVRELSPEEFQLEPEWKKFPTAMLLRQVMYSDIQIRLVIFNKEGRNDWVCQRGFMDYKGHTEFLAKNGECLMTNSEKFSLCLKLNCDVLNVQWKDEADEDHLLFCKTSTDQGYAPVFCVAHNEYRSIPPDFDTPFSLEEALNADRSWDTNTALSGPNAYTPTYNK